MRLGDDIDDHCSRCKRTTDHSIVSMMGEEVLRTRCRTCNSEHKFRQNKSRTKEMTAKEAFDSRAGQRYRRAAIIYDKKEQKITNKGHEGSQRNETGYSICGLTGVPHSHSVSPRMILERTLHPSRPAIPNPDGEPR
jgi:hypothetical protein